MKRSKHQIGTLVLFVMFVSIHSVSAHVGQLGHVDAIALVEPLKVGNDNYIRSTATADIDTGIHEDDERHDHFGTYYLHIYIVPVGGDPGNAPGSIFAYKSGSNVRRSGRGLIKKSLSRDKSVLSGCWFGVANATAILEWSPNGYARDQDDDHLTVCAATPNAMVLADPLVVDDVKAELSEVIDTGGTGINSALYYEGQILPIEFDPNDSVYTYETSDTVLAIGNSDLVDGYLRGDSVDIVPLDVSSGETSLAAPPRLIPKRTLTTTWAEMK